MPMTPKTLCHIVAGPLGVGKTSAILHYLRDHGARQRIGVLVNDFGPVGLDSTTLAAEAPTTKVINVPGGCICCTMLATLPESIGRMVSDQALDRLIIEPSGMATPAKVIDVLRQMERETNVSLQPVIVMLSAADFDEETLEQMPYYQMFHEAADILVFNRCDQASASKVGRAKQWADKLDPPKLRVVSTSHGQLPAELFDLSVETPHTHEPIAGAHHHHDHDPTVHPGGFVLDAGRVFDEEILRANLARIRDQGIAENRVLRLKGVFHTQVGWQSIEIANREVSMRSSAHRRDSRMEWLTQPGVVDQTRMLMEIERPLN